MQCCAATARPFCSSKAISAFRSNGTAILAPLPGILVSYEVAVGDLVEADTVIAVLEAMKMANTIVTPVAGRVKAVNFKAGDSVQLNAVLAVVG